MSDGVISKEGAKERGGEREAKKGVEVEKKRVGSMRPSFVVEKKKQNSRLRPLFVRLALDRIAQRGSRHRALRRRRLARGQRGLGELCGFFKKTRDVRRLD